MSEKQVADDNIVPEPEEKKLAMVAGACYLPKDNMAKPQGEDAHFVCKEKQTIGVADGVGWWAKRGVDAGAYARELMSNSCIALLHEPEGAVDPKRVLQHAYSNTNAKGSSTACITTLKDNHLHYANVGDSGFMVFRGKRLEYVSPTQQHSFNHPYQLEKRRDNPSMADVNDLKVESGDIVVAGTDGLLDNLYPEEIVDILNGITELLPEQMAWILAECALSNSLDTSYYSPFTVASYFAGQPKVGGKRDDITVIVGKIEADSQR